MKKLAKIRKYVSKKRNHYFPPINSDEVNLNVGSGFQTIPGFTSLDIDSDWYRKSGRKFKVYNMITDNLPYSENSVDNIYCSHVIEHLPDDAVIRFIQESYRVLKNGSTLRIATPDAEFLWNVSNFENTYWDWRKEWFQDKSISNKEAEQPLTQADFFIREVATPACRYYIHARKKFDQETVFSLEREDAIRELEAGLFFDENFPGDHINAWDFDKVRKIGQVAGFKHIVRSKRGASTSSRMQGRHFDRTMPKMSLYVDLVK